MGLISYEFPRVPGGRSLIVRSFATSMPLDWYAHAAVAPLPVILLFHGGTGTAVDFMNDVDVRSLWDGTHHLPIDGTLGAPLIKAVVISCQGVSADGPGGDWNGGHVSPASRIGRVDDVSYVFDALERANRGLVEHFNEEYAPLLGVANIVDALDRSRVMLIAFSQGGEMGYRIAWESRTGAWPWVVTAMCIAGSTIGGWNTMTSFNNGDPPLADWTPPTGRFVSLLQIHGEGDDRLPFAHPPGSLLDERTVPAVAANTIANIGSQLEFGVPLDDYARGDFTATGVHLKVKDAGDADFGLAVAGTPLVAALPATTTPTAYEWTDPATGALLALYSFFDSRLEHAYPGPGPGSIPATAHVVDFFQRFGGL